MYISKISIKNFRGINEQTINFIRFNSLIGKNDCGKSTIINAINFFFNDENANRDKDFNKYVSENKDIIIQVEISEYDTKDLKHYLVGEKDTGFDSVVQDYVANDILKIKKVWEFSEAKKEISPRTYLLISSFEGYPIYNKPKATDFKKWTTELGVVIPKQGEGNNSNLEKQSYIRQKLIENGVSREDFLYEEKWTKIKDYLPEVKLFPADQSIETTTTEFKKTFSTEIKNIIKSEKENKKLEGIEEAIKKKIEQEAEEIKDFMKEHISDLDELKIIPNFDWVKGVEITDVEIKLDGDQNPIPLENKGSGYRRLFMVGRLRYLAKKEESKNVIYLIEEPETFLHPSAQDEMRDSLIDLSESNQIFITTHSPIFTGATKPEGLILCKKDSTELIYEKNEKDEGFLIKIAEEIGVKPSHSLIDNFDAVVFVEHVNDEKFYRIAMEKLGYESDNRILFIGGGGSNIASIIEIKYFQKEKQPNRKIYLLIDSDIFDENCNEFLKGVLGKNKNAGSVFDNKNNGSRSEKKKIENLKSSFKGDKIFTLKKRCIENYYHPNVVKNYFRINHDYEDQKAFPDGLVIDEYLKFKGLENKNPKNQHAIFEQMTKEEWQEVSNGELEGIFSEILEN